jgi:hypothetical protein
MPPGGTMFGTRLVYHLVVAYAIVMARHHEVKRASSIELPLMPKH